MSDVSNDVSRVVGTCARVGHVEKHGSQPQWRMMAPADACGGFQRWARRWTNRREVVFLKQVTNCVETILKSVGSIEARELYS